MQTSSNSIKRAPTLGRAVVALAVAVALLRWLAGVAVPLARTAAAGAPLRADEVLAGLVAVTASLVVLWGLVGLALEVAGFVPGVVGDAARTASAALTPRLLRRSVGLVLGVGLAAATAPGASLAAAPATRAVVASSPLPDPGFAALPDPGWVPVAPTVRPQPDVPLLTPAPAAAETGEVVVRRGDTLWSIAARHLGPLPGDAEIAAAWPAWHETNRDVIGRDPDLLLPGQVLQAPQEAGS